MSRILALAMAVTVSAAAADGPMSLSVERASGDMWTAVDASTVFRGGDEIRFRLRSTEPGFLYILNETGKGERSWIYPPPGDLHGNRVEAGQEYTIPAGDAAFRVADQPGYDSLYYILTSVRLPGLPSAVPPIERPPANKTLLPRCNEGTLRSRGVCTDGNAGTRPVLDSRRIDTLQQLMGPGVRTGAAQTGKLYIYELRLAHR